jgi:PTH1 family peptidyl-tRNA hydrolase
MPRKAPASDRWLVVGLGNPGREYLNTRHNLGFSALALLASQEGLTWRYRERYSYACGEAYLVRPLTFMNLSGQAVRQVVRERGFIPKRMLVVCDDINLPLGRLRLRGSGSHGGQNGLRSVIDSLGTQDFPRLRLGIGPCPPALDASRFVLGRFAPEQRPLAEQMVHRAAQAVREVLGQGLEKAMNTINQKTE